MSAPSDLFLAVDMQNRRLAAFGGGPTAPPDLFQSNVVSLKVQCVNPSGTSSPVQVTAQSYNTQNLNGYGMRVSVGATPTGTSGGPAVLALATLTWDNVNQWFSGDLALNTTGIDTLIGAGDHATAYFEINLVPVSGNRITIFQSTFTVRAVVDEFTSLVPTPTDQYFTANITNSKFMPRIGEAGAVLTLTSPNGLLKMELGIKDDGSFSTNIIQ